MNTKYRIKGWYLLLNMIVALVTLSGLIVLAGFIIFFVILVVFAFRNGEIRNVISLGMFSGVVILLGALLTVFGIVFPLGNALFSYLEIGSTGVELRIWPFYRLGCAWHEVVGVEKVSVLRGLLSLPMLRFRGGTIESWLVTPHLRSHHATSFEENPSVLPLFLMALLLWSVNDKNMIPLHIFSGWPHGDLARELTRYVSRS